MGSTSEAAEVKIRLQLLGFAIQKNRQYLFSVLGGLDQALRSEYPSARFYENACSI